MGCSPSSLRTLLLNEPSFKSKSSPVVTNSSQESSSSIFFTPISGSTLPPQDAVAVLLTCGLHQQMALSRCGQGLWFPCAAVPPCDGHLDTIQSLLFQIQQELRSATIPCIKQLEPCGPPPVQLAQFRFYLQLTGCITVSLYAAELIPSEDAKQCPCLHTPLPVFAHVWKAWDALASIRHLLNGYEPVPYAQKLISKQKILFTLKEYSCPPPRPYWYQDPDLIEHGQILYEHFTRIVFPSAYLSSQMFERLIMTLKTQFNPPDMNRFQLFRAFDKEDRDFLTYEDFLAGIEALAIGYFPPSFTVETQHASTLFRYYSTGTFLYQEDFARLIKDAAPNVSLKECAKLFQELAPEIPGRARALNENQFRDLCVLHKLPLKDDFFRVIFLFLVNPWMKSTELKPYALVSHYVKVSFKGRFLARAPVLNGPEESKVRLHWNQPAPKSWLDSSLVLPSASAHSSLPFLRILAQIHEHNLDETTGRLKNHCLPENRFHYDQQMFQQLLWLCAQAKRLLEKEPRLPRISIPCYLFGDHHGHLDDLIRLERLFWPLGAEEMVTDNYCFLGDFVDRGDHQVETIAYLLCMKLLAPDRFHLIRGNHETWSLNIRWFQKACHARFGPHDGQQLWYAFNEVFASMPMAAIVGGSIFCAHGGMPGPPTIKLDELERELVDAKLPNLILDPKAVIPYSYQVLWNDPISARDWISIKKHHLTKPKGGYAFNTSRRGGYYWSPGATDVFLSTNGLTHIIRAHQYQFPGFKLDHAGLVITVFGASYYEKHRSRSTCALVNEERRIRLIQFNNEDKADDYGVY